MISLKRNFSWMFFGNIFYTFSQWILVTILAKFTDASIVGAYTYGLALSAPIMLFFNFQMRVIISTDSEENIKFSKYYSYRLLSMFIGVLLILFILGVINIDNNLKVITLLIAVNKAIEGLSEICYGYYQQKEHMKHVSTSLIIRGTISIGAMLIGILITESLLVSLILMNISWLLIHLLHDLKVVKKKFEIEKVLDFDWSIFCRLLKIGFPLGIVVMLGSLSANIPSYFIESKIGIKELGIYGALTYILVGTGKFFSTLTQVVGPRIAMYYNRGLKKELIKIITNTFCIIVLLILIIISISDYFGEQLLTIIYSQEYSEYKSLFVEIMILGGFMYIGSLFGTIVTAMKVYTLQIPIHLLKITIIIIFTFLLINKYGISAPVYALILAYISSLLLYGLIIIKKIINMKNSL